MGCLLQDVGGGRRGEGWGGRGSSHLWFLVVFSFLWGGAGGGGVLL